MMKNKMKRGILLLCILTAAGFLLWIYQLNQIEREPLMETEGREFVKARVLSVIKDNEEAGAYIGNQTVLLELLSGSHKGTTVEALSSSSYLYGAHCREGMKVTTIVSESQGELVASVYSFYREPILYGFVALFLLLIWLLGGKQGLCSIGGLAFTFFCILYFFLPFIYRGYSPVLGAVITVILTTVVTMFLIAGFTKKSLVAMLGTITGVIVAGILAYAFGKFAKVTGYNVSDIENLVYVQEQTGIEISELLFSGILIAALGAVMDVSMSIASSLQEIQEQNPSLGRKELFQSGMRIGKDMMGTMSNTLILAFTGGSINTIVFLYAYAYQYQQIINMYDIAIEIMQGVASSCGVILTVPVSSLLCAVIYTRQNSLQS